MRGHALAIPFKRSLDVRPKSSRKIFFMSGEFKESREHQAFDDYRARTGISGETEPRLTAMKSARKGLTGFDADPGKKEFSSQLFKRCNQLIIIAHGDAARRDHHVAPGKRFLEKSGNGIFIVE